MWGDNVNAIMVEYMHGMDMGKPMYTVEWL
jgi:hypothetical protein